MGSAEDFENIGFRRLLVNASYWAIGMEAQISEIADVSLVGFYHPRSFLDTEYTKDVHPADLAK
jgi:hypothetical protein